MLPLFSSFPFLLHPSSSTKMILFPPSFSLSQLNKQTPTDVHKIGSFFSSKKTRWFVLRSDFTLLSCIDSSFEETTHPSKTYSLINCQVEWGKLATKEYAVRIQCRRVGNTSSRRRSNASRKLTFVVDDQGSMNTWIGGLRCLFAGSDRILCDSETVGGDSCSICLADFEVKEKIVILPCEHRFCSNGCIENWLKISSRCPNCKQDCLVHGSPLLRTGEWRNVSSTSSAGESKN